ncbi:MAG: hypothetical protein V3W18_00350 [candidate division Zixibacteria bacterium]
MSEALTNFFSEHTFWAVVIMIFMLLPIIGAVFHILIKALGGRGIDNSPPAGIPPEYDDKDD